MQNEISQIIKENYIKIKCLSLPVNLKALIRLCIYCQRTVILCFESIGHTFLYQNNFSVHRIMRLLLKNADHKQIIFK